MRRFDEDNQRTRILPREEEKRLLEQLVGKRAHLRPTVRLAIQTMLRRSELLGSRKENLGFERNLIRVTNAGLRRAMETLTVTPGQTDAIVPTRRTAAAAGRRKLLNLLVAGGDLNSRPGGYKA